MTILRKTLVATALLGAGLGATTGAAFANGSDAHPGTTTQSDMGHESGNRAADAKACQTPVAATQDGQDQSGALNASDVQTIVPLNGCNNLVPVNVLGVQVPVQDATANVPVGSPSGDEGDGSTPSPFDGIL